MDEQSAVTFAPPMWDEQGERWVVRASIPTTDGRSVVKRFSAESFARVTDDAIRAQAARAMVAELDRRARARLAKEYG